MYQRILCPIDGSPTSKRGMKEAIQLAINQQAQLHFIHVIDTYFPILDVAGGMNVVDISDILRKNAEKIIKSAKLAALKEGVIADATITETLGSRAANFIVKEADKWQADLIVMGTHGLRGFARMVIGSDAEYVIRHSVVPVLMVKIGKRKS